MMAYGIPVCSSSLACCLSLLSDYADKTVLAATRDQVRGLDLQNVFFSLKKKSFFLKPFSWRVSQPFPTNSCPGKATGALFCSLESRRRAGDGMKQQYLRPLLPLGTRHCRAAALHSASSLALTHSGTLESYLPLLHLSTSISYTVKWNHPTWWRSELHMSCFLWMYAGHVMLHMHKLHINYVLFQTYLHIQLLSYGHFFVSEAGLRPGVNRTTSLGIMFSC